MSKKKLTSLVGLSQELLDKDVKQYEERMHKYDRDELRINDLTGEMRECGDTTWLQSWLDEVEADAKKDGDTINDRHRHKFTHAPNGVRGRRRVCAPSARARVSPPSMRARVSHATPGRPPFRAALPLAHFLRKSSRVIAASPDDPPTLRRR